jgi:rRNA-processing protein FCF1
MPVPVILDTNALLLPFKFNIDLDQELGRLLGAVRIMVPDTVIAELDNIAGSEARAAEALARRYETVEAAGKGDRAILDVAEKLEAVLVTNDRDLIERAKKAGLKVVRMRGKDHLALD